MDRRGGRRGFSVQENWAPVALIVLLVIGVVLSVVRFRGATADRRTTIAYLSSMRDAQRAFFAQHHHYARRLEQLASDSAIGLPIAPVNEYVRIESADSAGWSATAYGIGQSGPNAGVLCGVFEGGARPPLDFLKRPGEPTCR